MWVGAKSVTTWLLPLLVLAAGLGLLASGFGERLPIVKGLEFDTYQRLRPRLYEDTAARSGFAVRVLAIDNDSIGRLGNWPWSHAVLARLVGELKDSGASMVVLAFPLDAPDTPNSEASGSRADTSPRRTPDEALASALMRLKCVTGFTLGETGDRAPAAKSDMEFVGAGNRLSAVPQFQHASPALSGIEAASAGTGALNLFSDPDARIRSVPMVMALNGHAVASLEAEVMRLASADSNLVIRGEDTGLPWFGGAGVLAGASAGNFDVPLRADGALEIYFTGPRDERIVSAGALDAGRVGPAALKDAIVFIAPPVEVDTPAGRRSVGEVRAEAVENVLLGAALKPVSSPLPALVFLLVAGLSIVVLLAGTGVGWAGAIAFVAIAAGQGLSWLLFSRMHVLLDTATPNLMLAFVYLSGVCVRMLEIARTRAELKESFSDLVPARTIEEIAHAPGLLRLGGESRLVTCLSCGIRRYAALAASFAEDPAGFTRLLNMTMAPLIDDAVGHGAMIGPFDGEHFTAYWNAPLPDSEHAMHACEAATRMTMSLAEVNEQLSYERRFDGTVYAPLEVGIGIATGPSIAGGLSAHGRMTYAVTGECTVLAGRIRAVSGQYGPAVVVSESTREAASRGYAFLEVDFLALGSTEQPVKLYAMLGNPLVRASPKFRALVTFHDHIFQSLRAQQWERTRDLIEQCRKLSGASQKMYDLQLARVDWFEKNPPGADWDGAFRPILT